MSAELKGHRFAGRGTKCEGLSFEEWLAAPSPLAFNAGDTNLYRYVTNDPTNEVDPSGLEADLKSDYDAYKEALLKDNNRVTSLLNAVKEGQINRSWTQQEVLDFYVMFVNQKGSGLTEGQVKLGFSELQRIFDAANSTKPPIGKDYCAGFWKGVQAKIGALSVIQYKLVGWETSWGLCPEFSVSDWFKLGGYVEHEALWFTLPKVDIKFSNPPSFGLDDALVGGISSSSQHIFGVKDIPKSYKPVGTRTWIGEMIRVGMPFVDYPSPPP